MCICTRMWGGQGAGLLRSRTLVHLGVSCRVKEGLDRPSPLG